MPNNKVSKPRSTKYDPLLRGITLVLVGFAGVWLLYDASQGGRWYISYSFPRLIYDIVGKNGTLLFLGLATVYFFVGGFWGIISAIIKLRKNDAEPRETSQ